MHEGIRMTKAQAAAWSTLVCAGWIALFPTEALSAKQSKRLPAGPLITVHTPHPEQFEMALDEIELEWTDSGNEKYVPDEAPIMVHGARVVKSEASRAIVALSGITGPTELSMMATVLKAANPGAEAHLILFEPGLPQSSASRRLLTREVGVVLEEGKDPQELMAGAGLPAGSIRGVPGVPSGYVVEADDPLAALTVADALRQRSGVQSAYPLLKRAYFPR